MRHGSHIDPPNRFEQVRRQPDLEQVQWDDEYLRQIDHRKIEYCDDSSKTIVTENRSPDLPFRYSVNPYRGCVHGCSYCYARPTHEYLGLNAGLDFETKIVVKRNAGSLFQEFLARKSWVPEPIAFSGVTDCYQPAEREFQLTRDCLSVAAKCHQPVNLVTKNALITRDIDILGEMAERSLAHAFVSITTLEPELAREMEPRTSIPAARLRAIEMLTAAGIPVGVMVAPVIPGLNDHEIAGILSAARDAGAVAAGYVLLRLPLTVLPVFEEWIGRTRGEMAEKILGRIRQTRDGSMNHSDFGSRMVGTGPIAEQIQRMFRLFRDQQGLVSRMPPLDCRQFRPPRDGQGQLSLF
ncbi:MAG: PA0069 family radical SAM protein [Rubripirellula sp.]